MDCKCRHGYPGAVPGQVPTLEVAASRAQSRLELLSWVPMECREPLDSGPISSTFSSSSVTIFSATTYSPAAHPILSQHMVLSYASYIAAHDTGCQCMVATP